MVKTFDTKIINAKKNKKGFVLEKTIQLTANGNKKITIADINKMYKQLYKKHDRSNIIIRAMAADGMKTLKGQDFIEDDLKWTLMSYYRSHGPDAEVIKEKFKTFFYVDISILN
jgi:hypothetical protein